MKTSRNLLLELSSLLPHYATLGNRRTNRTEWLKKASHLLPQGQLAVCFGEAAFLAQVSDILLGFIYKHMNCTNNNPMGQ